MVESDRTVGTVFGLAGPGFSLCVLCPSDSSVPNFKLERLEVLEYIGRSGKRVVDGLEGLEGWRCCEEDMKAELDLLFKLANVTEDCSYL